MYLLYIDGSGGVKNPTENYFVLGGVAVFERQIYHLIQRFDEFVESLNLGVPSQEVELHASVIANGGKHPWKGIPRKDRLAIIGRALDVLRASHWSSKLFAVAVHKGQRSPDDPVEYAFEEICNRFDLMLRRRYNREGRSADSAQRGLVIMDESKNYEAPLQSLARRFRLHGTRWGNLRNLAEVPLFVDSQASRIVQIADLATWAVWRRYEYGDTRYFDKIASKFDSEGGVLHGLVHYRPPGEDCLCPACHSRALRNSAISRP